MDANQCGGQSFARSELTAVRTGRKSEVPRASQMCSRPAPAPIVMSSPSPTQAAPLPAHAQLIQMATAYWVSRAVCVTAELGLADLLAAGPLTADELAARTQTHAPSLYRLLRTLA